MRKIVVLSMISLDGVMQAPWHREQSAYSAAPEE
jgi:hypothetical protein